MPVTVHFQTLGCPKNEVDTEHMRAAVSSSSFDIVEDIEDATVSIINTCSFIQPAVEESIEAILDQITTWKDAGPDRKLVVTGCLPSRYGHDLESELPEVDVFIPVASESALVPIIADIVGERPVLVDHPLRERARPSEYVQIAEGCDRHCAYCTIPSIRGHLISTTPEIVLAEASYLVANGTREIVLVGQDTSVYGEDLPGSAYLPGLMTSLAEIPDLTWLRLMYLQPSGISDRLLESMSRTPTVCHYMDVPIQHASERILRSMRRPDTPDSLTDLFVRARTAMPDIVIRTTVMCGYPGETETDVDLLTDFLESTRPERVGVFPFYAEEGTAAATLPDQIPVDLRMERTRRIRSIADGIAEEDSARRIGTTVDVLIEASDHRGGVGRWCGQAPEIDGVVHVEDDDLCIGNVVNARIDGFAAYDLFGKKS